MTITSTHTPLGYGTETTAPVEGTPGNPQIGTGGSRTSR